MWEGRGHNYIERARKLRIFIGGRDRLMVSWCDVWQRSDMHWHDGISQLPHALYVRFGVLGISNKRESHVTIQ
jgi:hypothetical protein